MHRRARIHATGPPRGRNAVPSVDRTRGTAAIAIASNQAFSGWTGTFSDPRLCAAIIERLTFAGLIIETGTESYRLAHAKAARAVAS